MRRRARGAPVNPHARLEAISVGLEISAAVQGLGVVCTFEGFLQDALSTGALETIPEPWTQYFPRRFLYYASRRHMPVPLRAFVDFLKTIDLQD